MLARHEALHYRRIFSGPMHPMVEMTRRTGRMPQRTGPWLPGMALALLLGCSGNDAGSPTPAYPESSPTVVSQQHMDSVAPAPEPTTPAPTSEPETDDDNAADVDIPLDQRLQALIEDGSHPALQRGLRLLLNPSNTEAAQSVPEERVTQLVQGLIDWDTLGLHHETTTLAQQDLPLLQRWNPEDVRVLALAAQLQQAQQILEKLAQADRLKISGRFEKAVALLREVLNLEPGHPGAQRRLANIEYAQIQAALAAARTGDFAQAERVLADAGKVRGGSAQVQNAAVRILEKRERDIERQQAAIAAALATGDVEAAQALLPRLDAIALDERPGRSARADIQRVQLYGVWDVGALVVDPLASGGLGPGMVVIPAGQFQMGSSRSETGHQANEARRHPVRFARGFALARTEITVAQFRRFIEATERRTTAERRKHSLVYDERGGALVERRRVTWRDDYTGKTAADDMPVLHVSWLDAQAYAKWLSQETGQHYRLPSEAEFEYALRAGSASIYPWGDGSPPANTENLTGALDQSPTRRNWGNAFKDYGDGYWGPAPVASFASNAFGLNDMNGNASEWVADCWHDSYARAPTDGSAWVNPGCKEHVVRGASWASSPTQARSAFRIRAPSNTVNARVGFRVAREL